MNTVRGIGKPVWQGCFTSSSLPPGHSASASRLRKYLSPIRRKRWPSRSFRRHGCCVLRSWRSRSVMWRSPASRLRFMRSCARSMRGGGVYGDVRLDQRADGVCELNSSDRNPPNGGGRRWRFSFRRACGGLWPISRRDFLAKRAVGPAACGFGKSNHPVWISAAHNRRGFDLGGGGLDRALRSATADGRLPRKHLAGSVRCAADI